MKEFTYIYTFPSDHEAFLWAPVFAGVTITDETSITIGIGIEHRLG